MSTYQELKGLKIKYLDDDTSGDRLIEGEIFYNSTTSQLKAPIGIGAWSSGGHLPVATSLMAGAGTQTAALGFGGYKGPGTPNVVAETYDYNGILWDAAPDLNAARSGMGGTGTQTAALGFGGSTTIPRAPGEVANSEEYNGSSWTEGNNLNDALVGVGGLGTQTAAVAFGGGTPDVDATEHYDGTSWTNVPGTLTSARRYLQGCGTQTAGLTAGGDGTSTNEYDGSSWTAGGNMNTGRPNTGAVSGIQTHALMSGGGSGGTPVSGKTEEYDGTSWTEVADMAQPRYSSASANASPAVASLAFGGYLGGTGYIISTEEWNNSTSTITSDSWASGGNLPAVKNDSGGAGTLTAGLQVGGTRQPSSPNSGGLSTQVETNEYDGSSWTAGGDMNTGRATFGNLGTQTAALAFGGRTTNNPFTYTANSEEYNGSSWTEGNNLGAVKYYMNRSGAGTQTAGLSVGGHDLDASSPTSNVEEYNGTSWSEVNNAPVALLRVAGAGTQTASVFSGNQTNPKSATYLYDGTNWTVSPSTSNASNSRTAAGTQTAALFVGGDPTPFNGTLTEKWDGTSFSSSANLATGREAASASATSQAANFVCGGNNPSGVHNSTEEFSLGTTTVNAAKIIDFD